MIINLMIILPGLMLLVTYGIYGTLDSIGIMHLTLDLIIIDTSLVIKLILT